MLNKLGAREFRPRVVVDVVISKPDDLSEGWAVAPASIQSISIPLLSSSSDAAPAVLLQVRIASGRRRELFQKPGFCWWWQFLVVMFMISNKERYCVVLKCLFLRKPWI